jgi:hypothetical protein
MMLAVLMIPFSRGRTMEWTIGKKKDEHELGHVVMDAVIYPEGGGSVGGLNLKVTTLVRKGIR